MESLNKSITAKHSLKLFIISLITFLIIGLTACTSTPNSASQIAEIPSETTNIPTLRFSKTAIYPGDYLTIYIENCQKNDTILITSEIITNTPIFQPYERGKVGLIPISYYIESENYPLQIKILNNNKTVMEDQQVITIKSKKFATQHLNISAEQKAKRNPEQWKENTVLIEKAKAESTSEPLWKGQFLLPVTGRISTEFGLNRFINNAKPYRHSGLDIAVPKGTPIKAANNGIVKLVRSLNITGNTIILDHGLNLFSTYYHLDKILVSNGAKVEKGDIIGEVGSTGFSTGPHLHWEISIGLTFVNPWLLLEEDPLLWIDKSPQTVIPSPFNRVELANIK